MWRIGAVYYFVFCFFLAAQSYTGPYKSKFSFMDLGALVMTGMIFFPAFFMGGILGSLLGRLIKRTVVKRATT